jgi:Fe2+ or Zn2+ uptake regulation protein
MDSIDDRLQASRVRRTPARRAVLVALQDLGRPVSHADLQCHEAVAGLDPVTVYRSLATLQAAGIAHGVHGIDGTWRFGLHPEAPAGRCGGGHAHFLCRSCGGMRCLLEQVIPKLHVEAGASVEGRQLLAFGRCAPCNLGASR